MKVNTSTARSLATRKDQRELNLTTHMFGFCSYLEKMEYPAIPCHSKASLWVPTNEAYWPFLANNSKWLPSSAILPLEQRAIWSAFWTVLNLCAITNVVLPFIRWLRASWTRRSLIASKALVACITEENHIRYNKYQLGIAVAITWAKTHELARPGVRYNVSNRPRHINFKQEYCKCLCWY